MDRLLRDAGPGDLEQIAEIYNQGIAARIATFETEPREAAELSSWLDPDQLLVVTEVDGRISAFARTSPYRDRACYRGIREFLDVHLKRDGSS